MNYIVNQAMEEEHQRKFFRSIKKKLAPHENLAKVIAKAINVSPSTAYKLINAEMVLNKDHYRKLNELYAVTMENMYMGDPDKQTVVDTFHLSVHNMQEYVKSISLIYEKLRKGVENENISWEATANHTPIFHLLAFPNLSFLNMYLRVSKDKIRTLSYEAFVQSIPAAEIKDIHQKIYLLLKSLDSTEVISIKCLLDLKNLVLKVNRRGSFEKTDTAIALLDQICSMILQMKKWSIEKKKDGEGKFNLHLSKLNIKESLFLFFNNDEPSSYSLNLVESCIMSSGNERMCKDVEEFLVKEKEKNPCMSGVGHTQRNKIFDDLIRRTKDTKDKLH